jgi:hypothetical protein
MMKTIEFDSRHEAVFTINGFKTFDDFIDCNKGQMINTNKKRNVIIFSLASQEGQRVYFMKRFFSPHFKDMLFTVRNFGRLCSQAELELSNALTLLNNVIETYHPICWGAETFCGIERRSFFVPEKIRGQSLIEFLFDHWKAFGMVQRERLIVELAAFFRKLHKARLSLPDSYLWHLFLVEPIDVARPYKFAIIDLHRMMVNVSAPRHAAHNLGALLFSMPEEWFDLRLRNLFLYSYLELSNGNMTTSLGTFLETVINCERTLTGRRKKPDLEYLKRMV